MPEIFIQLSILSILKLEQLNACVLRKVSCPGYSTGSMVGDEKGFIYHLIQCCIVLCGKKFHLSQFIHIVHTTLDSNHTLTVDSYQFNQLSPIQLLLNIVSRQKM